MGAGHPVIWVALIAVLVIVVVVIATVLGSKLKSCNEDLADAEGVIASGEAKLAGMQNAMMAVESAVTAMGPAVGEMTSAALIGPTMAIGDLANLVTSGVIDPNSQLAANITAAQNSFAASQQTPTPATMAAAMQSLAVLTKSKAGNQGTTSADVLKYQVDPMLELLQGSYMLLPDAWTKLMAAATAFDAIKWPSAAA